MVETATSIPATVPTPSINLDGYDEEQVRLMEERCILVNERDEVYGEGSKKTCTCLCHHTPLYIRGVVHNSPRLTTMNTGHLMESINKGLLHRAFSVFLFRPSDGRLLLQKRADEKITFPGMWTNTCCSHPLSIRAESVEENQAGE